MNLKLMKFWLIKIWNRWGGDKKIKDFYKNYFVIQTGKMEYIKPYFAK